MARKTTAKVAQTLDMKRAVKPFGQLTGTAAPNKIAQTSQYVRKRENL